MYKASVVIVGGKNIDADLLNVSDELRSYLLYIKMVHHANALKNSR